MCAADEECVDLRQSWRSFMIPSGAKRREAPALACGCSRSRRHREYTLLQRYAVVGTNADEQPILFLSLISPNRELLRAATHLFVQFQAQYRQSAAEHEEKIMLLRAHHEQQLVHLLEAGNNGTRDMVVGSDVTKHFVLKHQRELEELQQQSLEVKAAMELELRQGLLAFLKTSASGAMEALRQGRRRMSSNTNNIRRCGRVTDMTHFVALSVPVRTVMLPNPLRHKIVGVRPKDTSLQPIVVDVSPISFLHTCLNCLYAEEHDTAPIVEEHLLRLSQQTHAVLLLIGSQEEAESTLSHPTAELFLQQGSLGAAGVPCFLPLGCHRHLKVMLTTRFWGANVVLLWTPPKSGGAGSEMPPVIEDALNLAFAWNADMFSVALMNSAVSIRGTAYCSTVEQAQDLSVHVLRQLQLGVAHLAYEAPGATLSSTWNGMDRSENEEETQRGQQDGHTGASPLSAGKLRVPFNTATAVRAFLPISLTSVDGNPRASTPEVASVIITSASNAADASLVAEKGIAMQNPSSATLFQGRESSSSDLTMSNTCVKSHQRLQQQRVGFEEMLMEAFGESVVTD